MSSVPAAAPASPPARPAPSTPAIIILGADALLAVRPATPGQLANACYAAGYSAVIPGSWGDELVAAGCLKEIAARGQGPVVLCSCPRVAEPMRRAQSVSPFLLAMVPPPVAAARYLRARAGLNGVHITYVGECPGASDPSIDRHATPAALLRSLVKRNINPADQPKEVEERLLRDGRRFYSLPGGAPAPNWLYAEKRGYTLVEPTGRDYLAEVAHRLAEKERRIIDLAPRLGCACSGAVVGEPWNEVRETLAAIEPPRAVHEVLDHDMSIELAAPIEPWTGSADIGQQTMSIPLAELAALHDPDAKAAPVRTAPPPPLPRPSRTGMRAPGEPASGGAAVRRDRPSGPRVTTQPVVQTTAPTPAAAAAVDSAITIETDIAARSMPGAPARENAAQLRPATIASPAEPTSNPARLAILDRPSGSTTSVADGEPITGPSRVSGRGEQITGRPDEPTTNGTRREPFSGSFEWPDAPPQRSRLGLIATTAAAIAVIVLGVAIARNFAPPDNGPTIPPAGAKPSSPTARVASTPNGIGAPAPQPTSDSAGSDTTVSALGPSPNLPRLPLGPAPHVPTASGMRAQGIRPEDTLLISPRFRRNPAPVFTPGAAPIPRGDAATTAFLPSPQQAVTTQTPGAKAVPHRAAPRLSRAAAKAGAAFSDALTPEAAAQMAAIRTEIVQRRHRVDSLKMVVDSLGAKIPSDSAAAPAPAPAPATAPQP